VSLEELSSKRRQALPEDLSRSEEVTIEPVGEPVTEELPVEQPVSAPVQFQPQTPTEERDPQLMSSATNPVPGPDTAFFFKKENFK
jgi:hypothetical protein